MTLTREQRIGISKLLTAIDCDRERADIMKDYEKSRELRNLIIQINSYTVKAEIKE